MTSSHRYAKIKTKPCCEVRVAAKVGADRVCFPGFYVGSISENRSEFEAKLAWLFEFRATFRDGSKKFLAWKVMGMAGDKALVYERLKRRADAENIVLIEICSVEAAMTDEQVQFIRRANEEVRRQMTENREQKTEVRKDGKDKGVAQAADHQAQGTAEAVGEMVGAGV